MISQLDRFLFQTLNPLCVYFSNIASHYLTHAFLQLLRWPRAGRYRARRPRHILRLRRDTKVRFPPFCPASPYFSNHPLSIRMVLASKCAFVTFAARDMAEKVRACQSRDVFPVLQLNHARRCRLPPPWSFPAWSKAAEASSHGPSPTLHPVANHRRHPQQQRRCLQQQQRHRTPSSPPQLPRESRPIPAWIPRSWAAAGDSRESDSKQKPHWVPKCFTARIPSTDLRSSASSCVG